MRYGMTMATKIETTVSTAAADLAKAGLAGNKRVMMIVLDEEDEAKLAELRATPKISAAVWQPSDLGEPTCRCRPSRC